MGKFVKINDAPEREVGNLSTGGTPGWVVSQGSKGRLVRINAEPERKMGDLGTTRQESPERKQRAGVVTERDFQRHAGLRRDYGTYENYLDNVKTYDGFTPDELKDDKLGAVLERQSTISPNDNASPRAKRESADYLDKDSDAYKLYQAWQEGNARQKKLANAVTESEFNRSNAMQEKYGTYNDYIGALGGTGAPKTEYYSLLSQTLSSRPDFPEKSKYKSTANGKEKMYAPDTMYLTETGYDDILYDYINGNEDARYMQAMNDVQTSDTHKMWDELPRWVIETFNYLYAEDEEKGDRAHTTAYEFINLVAPEEYTILETGVNHFIENSGIMPLTTAAISGVAALTNDDELKIQNKQARTEWKETLGKSAQQHPIAATAGGVTGSMALMATAGAGTSGLVAGINTTVGATAARGAITYAMTAAVQQSGDVTTGIITPGQYGKKIFVQAAQGAAGNIAGELVSIKIANVLSEKQLMTPFMEFIKQTARGVADSLTGNTVSYLLSEEKPTSREIAENLVTSFAFSIVFGAVDAQRAVSEWDAETTNLATQLGEVYTKLCAEGAGLTPEAQVQYANKLSELTQELQTRLRGRYVPGQQEKMDQIDGALTIIDGWLKGFETDNGYSGIRSEFTAQDAAGLTKEIADAITTGTAEGLQSYGAGGREEAPAAMPTVTQPEGSVTQPAEQVIQPETPQVMAPRPGENVTLPRDGETVSGQETAAVKSLTKLIKENIPAVADMPSVAEVKGNELPNQGTVTERLLGFIRSIGGKVTRHGFGDVLFSKNRIKGSVIGHGIGNAKIETFAAVPQVIQQGKQVDHQSNWKGRGYDTYTFMAPITYRGNPTYLGVIVAKDNNSNRYYLHEVADEDGNIIYTNRGTPDSAPDARASQTGAYDSVAENEVPAPIIPQEAMTVNGVMAPRPGEETILPGGTNNGEQTQDIQRNGNGEEAAVAGEDAVYGGDAGGRPSYTDAGRPESVRPPAGVKGATRENRALTFQRQKAATDQPYISPASLGIDGGGEEATMRILAPDDWDDELRGLNSWLGDKGIREVHMVVGTITVDNGGGPVDVLDVIKKDTGELFLRVDSLSRSATETGVHAAGHYMADEEKITRFMNAVKSRKNAVWEPMYEKYMQKWAQVTNYYEGMTEAEKELYVWEEILGDAYANINNMGTRASAFHDIAEAVLEGTGELQTGSEVSLAEGENAAAAAGIRGPPRYMTAGESGKNADLNALATAKAMQQEGASEESILALTGWYQGSDGKWRWEINDSDMTYHRGGDAAFSQSHADYAEYQELMRKWMTGDVTAEEETRLQKLDETWGREYGRLSERVDRGNATLEDILDHEALFRAYPQLRRTKVEFADLQRGTRGSYSPSGNKITLSNELRGAPQETLVHEIQHAIQKIEGFSGGSSPKYWEERLTSGDEIQSKGFQDAREKLIRFQLDEANEEALALKDKIEQAGELDDDLTEYDRLWEEAERRGLDGKINEYYDLRDNYYTQMNRPGNSVPSELYSNTAGEIEARETANRWKMTAEERRNSLPYRGDENTVFADGGENLDYVGETVDGTEVYETSEAILKLPYKQRMEAFMDIMRNEYAGRTAKFTARDGEIYYATFDENDLRKNVYGDKKSSSRGWKAKINTGADGNIFDLVENAEHSGSGKEQGKTSEAHQGLTGWEYFVKTVQIDGRVYDLLANVRKKPDGEFVYSIQLNENKKKAPAPPRQYQNGTAKAENRPVGVPTDASKTSVAEGETGVKSERDALKGYFDENGRFVLPRAAEEDAADEAPKQTANRYSVDDEQDAAEKKKKKEGKPVAKSRPIIAKKELRQNMMNIFSIPAGSKNMLGDVVDQVADKLLETGTLSWEERKEFFDRMYDSGVMTVAADEYSRDARDVVLKRKIYVPESVKQKFGGSEDYNEFRKTAFAAGVYLTNNKSDEHIDTLNMELAERLPGLFDANDLDMTEILKTVVQVAEEGKGEKMSLAEYTAELAGREYVSEDEVLDNLERQVDWALRTFAEKAKLEVTLRDRTGVKLAQQREAFGEMQNRQREREQTQRLKERDARKEQLRRQRENRELQELQQKTLKNLQWLKKNRNKAPAGLLTTWDEVLGDIDIYAVGAANEMRWSEKYQATWKDLAQMYKDAQNNDPNFLPSKELERIVARVDYKKIADMDIDALNDLYKAAVGLRTEFYNRNRILGENLNAAVDEVYQRSKGELEFGAGGKAGNAARNGNLLDKFVNMEQLSPMNVMERMAGWNPESSFYSMAKQLEKGEKDIRAYTVKAQKQLKDFLTENADWVKTADGQGKDGVWYELEVPELLELGHGDAPIFGDSVKVYMTPSQKVHMYLESKNYDNLLHMAGGRTFPNKELYSQGKRREAFAQGKTIRLAPETVKGIVSDLTAEEQALANALEKYYNDFAAVEINRVSNILYGYDKAMSSVYAPIYTNSNYTKSEIGVYEATAEGVGNLKERLYSKNPSYNIGAFDAFERHVEQTARFVGMAIPARNWQTLLNWREAGNSMKDVISHTWGDASLNYISDLIQTLQGGKGLTSDSVSTFTDKLFSNYISAVFGANPSIVFKQLGSIPLASAYLGIENFPSPGQVNRVDREFIGKYTQELDWRTLGYATPETKMLKENPNWSQSNKAVQFAFGGGAITAMDGWAASVLWPWAENTVRREFPELEVGTQEEIDNGTSPFYKKVAELFDEAVARSQSTSDEMHQGALRKSKNPVTRAFTMFKSDSSQTYNTLRQRLGEAKYYKSQGNEAKSKKSKKLLGAAVIAAIGGYGFAELIEFLMNLWKHKGKRYRDEDGELTAESVAKEMALGLVGDLAGIMSGGEELAELIGNVITGDTWYGIDTPGLEQLTDVIETIMNEGEASAEWVTGAANVVKNGGNLPEYLRRHGNDLAGSVKELAMAAATYLPGLPVNNLEAYILGAVKWIAPSVATAYEDAFATAKKSSLKGLTGAALEQRVGDILSKRGVKTEDEVRAALAELYEAGFTDAVPVNTPGKVSVDGEDRELNAYQQQTYDTVWSGTISGALEELIGSADYQNADNETRAKMIDSLYDYAGEQARGVVFGDYEKESFAGYAEDIIGAGASTAEWAIWRGKTAGMKDAEKYALLREENYPDKVKAAIAGSLMGTEMETESGNPTAYAKMLKALDAGLSMDDYLELRAEDAVDRYLDAVEDGVKSDTARNMAIELAGLEPQEGKKSISDAQKWRAAIDAGETQDEQREALKAIMSESALEKYEIADSYGISPLSYVRLKEILPGYDADGNGSYSQAEITAAIDSLGGASGGIVLPGGDGDQKLTLIQQAALWQLYTGSKSAKNNPYSKSIGQQVIDERSGGTNTESLVLPR
nr:MAG TPA: Large polyvalent protein associated domain 23 [Caudoviricetes sp.]